MANERKTEALIRKRLEKCGFFKSGDLNVEEQKSDSPRIDKLLKNASKKGQFKGYPEFIVSSKSHSDFLIVIECKADATKHISKTLDKYSDFAVDGALLYASFLSKEFDVLAIAVSGETETTLRISHYLHLRGAARHVEFDADEILPFDDYYKNYIHSPVKFRQDYDALLNYSRELNEELEAKKIKEAHRGLLISGILVALGDAAFKKSFKVQKTAKNLANNLVESVVNELKSADLPHEKISSLKGEYSFIERNTTLTSDKDFFVGLIEQIDKNVNTFVRTYKYHDTLGQFYVQFLQYGRQANRSLGTLLIPSLDELPKWVSKANVDQFKGSDAPWMPRKIDLKNFKSWKTYSLNSLFKIKKGKRLTAAHMTPGTTPYIGAIDSNNGVSALIGQKPIHDAHTITVNYNGSVGEAYYQPVAFWATDDANVLYPRFKLTPSIAMFVIAVIRHETYRFNYGRKWNKRRMEESLIKLPVAADGEPDWQFMEDYIKGLPYSSVLK